jgi:pimeloyl-ACP methyl ester carboxylesterase
MLVLGGEKSGGSALIEQAKLVGTDVRGQIVTGSGHWLIDEAPQQVMPALIEFIS